MHDVEISSVSKYFNKLRVIDDVTLQVEQGEFLTLLGPSGCGKTTLLRLIAGFEQPNSGRILLGGEDVTTTPPYRRNVHTVFQQYALFPHLNVAGNVAFGLKRRGVNHNQLQERVKAVLDLVRLTGLEDRYPAQLSGGQQQRVAIARAIVLEPRVLLLDEPLSALDQKLRREMQVELKSLQRRLGISFVYVTHDQQEALTMSDRIAVMRAGRIEQLGRGEEVYERPRTPFVADFIGEANILNANVCALTGTHLEVEICGRRLEVAGRGREVGAQVKIAIRPEKIRISNTDSTHSLAGIVTERIYLGDSTHWRVELLNGSTVVVQEQNLGNGSFSRGESIYLSWDKQCAVLLEEDI